MHEIIGTCTKLNQGPNQEEMLGHFIAIRVALVRDNDVKAAIGYAQAAIEKLGHK